MVTTSRPVTARTGTPARWAAALARGLAEGITVAQHPVSGRFTATSSDGTRRYDVSWYTCTCMAGAGADEVCKHRAMFRQHCQDEDRQVAAMLLGDGDASDWDLPFPMDPPVAAMPADPFVALVQVNEDGGYDVIDLVGEPTEPEADELPEASGPPAERCWKCGGTGMVEVRYGFKRGDFVMGGCSCDLGRLYTTTGRAVA